MDCSGRADGSSVSRLACAELAAASRSARDGSIAPAKRDAILERMDGDFCDLEVVEIRAARLVQAALGEGLGATLA